MHGIHSVGSAPTAADDHVAVDTRVRAAFGPVIERVRSLRLPRALTAFTSQALLRGLVAQLEQARLSPHPPLERAASSRSGVVAKPARWCGASPLERKRAAWRERRRVSS